MLKKLLNRQRNLLGVLLRDRRRYNAAIEAQDDSYLALCNRNERLSRAPGKGYRCEWQWTSELHAPRVLPSLGSRLMRRAFDEHPIRRAQVLTGSAGEPKVSFVIGHRGTERLPHLLATLESIAGQVGVAVECIVVEQDVESRLAGKLPSWVHHVFVEAPALMPYCRSWGFNVGLRHCRGSILVLHDNDMLVPEDYAAAIAERVGAGFELVNLKRFIFYLGEQHSADYFAGRSDAFALPPESVVQNLEGGGSVAITREGYERIGGMDEAFVGWGGGGKQFWERAPSRRACSAADLA